MSTLTLTHAQVLDPSQGLNQLSDIVIEYGLIAAITPAGQSTSSNPEFDAEQALLIPGLIDLSANINNVTSETLAAAKGGITHLCAQPNSKPLIDTPANVSLLQQASAKANSSRLLPIGALTQNLAGDQLANMHSLKQAGCIALSNARAPIKNALVLRRIMEYAKTHNMLIMLTAEDCDLSANGKMHEGPTANRLGLAGIAAVAETTALAQQLLLVELTGCRTHFSQLSCGRSVAMIRDAQAQGLPVSADVAIANLMFTDEDVNGFNSTFYVQPPLRTEADRKALLAGVNDGTLAICSNHQAQDIAAKKAPFAAAEPGMSILDTWLSMMLTLVNKRELELNAMINASSILPAKILGLKAGLQLKQLANLVVVKQEAKVCYSADSIASTGKNNPVLGEILMGEVTLTLSAGREVYRA
ncbi:MAG: dihydroorotase [Oleispira antarctica]|uniref:Dihydroorotase, multifunctional complex type n=1 Tax=Oleispira antarctica RB-8 TaxID=698738 RepID=R4YME5_OLEAN|nr:dihydroorotase [Oleispira antarctica]MBQ0793417.1 dihydroorotase [Oleispira antarctica]CCK74258.1 Dihydroorotase, multifunctional complex type [Oleispira antarctica RB-8]|tara:strand:+ start:2059 stop:3306 length:1248 start_codon:yes stop_codon:yes gene_type:complete